MKQGLLAFQYEEEKSTTGMTALSGLMTYVELMHVAGLRSSVERRVGLRGGHIHGCRRNRRTRYRWPRRAI